MEDKIRLLLEANIQKMDYKDLRMNMVVGHALTEGIKTKALPSMPKNGLKICTKNLEMLVKEVDRRLMLYDQMVAGNSDN